MDSQTSIQKGSLYVVTFTHDDGRVNRIEMTRDEWLEMRRMQNALFFTEPK